MSKSHLDSLLTDTSSTLDLLTSLSNDFRAVESQTSQFRKQCEGLLSAQKHDSDLAENIQENLQYYDFLDPASRRLNAPGAGNTVRGKEFSDMLRRLDECLDYMETHVSIPHNVYRTPANAPCCAARSQRGRCIPLPVPFAHDSRPHLDPNPLCVLPPRCIRRCVEEDRR